MSERRLIRRLRRLVRHMRHMRHDHCHRRLARMIERILLAEA